MKKIYITPLSSRNRSIYLGAWLFYICFTLLAFPSLNASVFLFSVALSMLGAWYFGIVGAVLTVALSIPYHALLLNYFDSNESALNPFGISTQLLAASTVAYMRHTQTRLEHLNSQLEQIVSERTSEMNDLKEYIVQNSETTQIVLSHALLGDIGDSLTNMQDKCDQLLSHLAFDDDPVSIRAAKLKDMIRESIDIVENLGFVDRFFSDNDADFAKAVKSIARHFGETADILFDLSFDVDLSSIPMPIQHQLYRITQEAITNAIRHAEATCINIQLSSDDPNIQLVIMNDGHPMPPNVESGLGLKLMQDRVQAMGGSIDWDTTQQDETALKCSIPYPSE